ncbi:L-erythro-3-methylmalyl-CoA dehydratase [Paraburkholderia caballeronis]|uniref:MaoC family dehydratase n=1 Tax=Paraburkholderia caballeronis TaxID=416943 RepID=UPI0010DC8902|nr:MaoC family dehydratase [Paraburkholderia caballeronis]TDV35612.1 L-erythro-3-methylmalyl-CoA dehydratase [Paraburkholderia caballeronis]
MTTRGMPAAKHRRGRFFEDFRLGQVIRHGTPRTVTDGDASVYTALTGSRHVTHSSAMAARELGFEHRPIDDLLLFNIAFGKTVPDISLNAIANLGYAETRFLNPVFAGNTLRCESVVIGLKENSNRRSGIVYVRSTCYREDNHAVVSWVRWVMVPKADGETTVREQHVPALADHVAPDQLVAHARLRSKEALEELREATGSADVWDDYAPGERIDHPAGTTVEEAEHMMAARLYQNNARPHFDALAMQRTPTGRRLVYGGHVISVCRSLAYDGLENVLGVLAINGGTHAAPTVGGDTLYAYSEVIDKWKLSGRTDVGALRLRLVGLKNLPPDEVHAAKVRQPDGTAGWHPAVVLDLDYTVSMPRRPNERGRHE